MRQATIERKTGETQIKVSINLDGKGEHSIQTGIPFFDHMLTQISVHSLFDLQIRAIGDLDVDFHHTIEDVALTLGQAIDQALGDRKGIKRMSHAVVPMDESLCEIVIDFSGRPYCVFQGHWPDSAVGGIPVSLIEHFFYSLSMAMKANLHCLINYGRDNHHITEALFKATARALDDATRYDPRRAEMVPSSKGVL